ncbi:RecB family exonuclease [Bifidobacterium castoris]|uniref:RecB family exonuclease n=1 Tax=Bifidobacterium castoris TaxID=2306972 RepID=UPI001F49C9C1|nr:PD-(D/E)XK nuclease family protein [Bifidobacterium castoris]
MTLLSFNPDGTATPTARIDPPARFSHSTLTAWTQCPARWAADRLIGREPADADPLILGTIVHRAIQKAMDEPGVAAPDWRALTADAITLLRAEHDHDGRGKDPAPPITLQDGTRATDAYWAHLAWRKIRDFRLTDALGRTPRPAATEQHVEGEWDGIRLHGYVDYRDEAGILIDWKTGRIPAFADAARTHADQLRLYTHLYATMGVPVHAARDVYVEQRDLRAADLSAEAMDATRARIVAAATDMTAALDAHTQRLRLHPSALCPWCPLANVCPAARIDGAKARRAAAAQPVAAHDPRFVRTHAHATNDGKETRMDLSAFLMGEAAATSAPTRPDPPAPAAGTDPWATPAGREALAQWGIVDDTADTTPEPRTGKVPEPHPAAPPRMAEGKPWEATWDGTTLNPAGYGWSRWVDITLDAMTLACDDTDACTTATLIVQAAWAAARTALGEGGAPDIPGLAEGRPMAEPLFAWLDTTVARDTLRILRTLLDHDTQGTACERIGRAARRAADIWGAMLAPLDPDAMMGVPARPGRTGTGTAKNTRP